MSLSTAIQNKDIKELKATVESAVKIYEAGLPSEPSVDTVYGDTPISMIFDEDTKWALAIQQYVCITNKVKNLPAEADKKVETAKLIATNPVLRHLVQESKSTDGLL